MDQRFLFCPWRSGLGRKSLKVAEKAKHYQFHNHKCVKLNCNKLIFSFKSIALNSSYMLQSEGFEFNISLNEALIQFSFTVIGGYYRKNSKRHSEKRFYATMIIQLCLNFVQWENYTKTLI